MRNMSVKKMEKLYKRLFKKITRIKKPLIDRTYDMYGMFPLPYEDMTQYTDGYNSRNRKMTLINLIRSFEQYSIMSTITTLKDNQKDALKTYDLEYVKEVLDICIRMRNIMDRLLVLIQESVGIPSYKRVRKTII